MPKLTKFFKNTAILFLTSTLFYKYYTHRKNQIKHEEFIKQKIEFWETFLKHNKPN
mgnify:CR=1 FL=1